MLKLYKPFRDKETFNNIFVQQLKFGFKTQNVSVVRFLVGNLSLESGSRS